MTGAPDAVSSLENTVRVLHDWWNVSGDPGYLARYAAPESSDPAVLAIFDGADPYNHFGVDYDGETWAWRGHISRDQYQGVLLGFALAYEASEDEEIRELIREDVVEFVEQLMLAETHTLRIKTSDFPLGIPVTVEMQYCVFTDAETASGDPEITFDMADVGSSELDGFQEFHPRFYNYIADQTPLLSWIPEIPRSDSAVMLASFFRVALLVTDGAPGWETRRAAILAHYEDNVSSWLDVAENPLGYTMGACGNAYYGYNIRFEPMYNLARLETDPVLGARVRDNVLAGIMWPQVETHKNSWFAFIHCANQPWSTAIEAVALAHADQLALFPIPPSIHVARDLATEYPASIECPGQSTEAVDVDDRCVEDFMWQRHPWQLLDSGEPLEIYPGVDYLSAYWLGRRHGFVDDDAPDTCLRWRPND